MNITNYGLLPAVHALLLVRLLSSFLPHTPITLSLSHTHVLTRSLSLSQRAGVMDNTLQETLPACSATPTTGTYAMM